MLVLGIDAAWTAGQPSGVALAAKIGSGWRLKAVAPSYNQFSSAGSAQLGARPTGAMPDANALLQAAAAIGAGRVSLVAVDMPLSLLPITGRRASDSAVSRAYGARKCSTHSPSTVRPGPIGERLSGGFTAAGYPLCTQTIALPGLIEVYPHPALVELSGAAERHPYKASKVRNYWPALTSPERRARLLSEWSSIIRLLDHEIDGVAEALPPPPASSPAVVIKAYEDMLDAVVCAWVGIEAIGGRAKPFGDQRSAIWVPTPRPRSGPSPVGGNGLLANVARIT